MIKLNLLKLQEKLGQWKKNIFTPQDLKLFFGARKRAINGFLSYNSKRNRIIKLKKKLYSFKINPLNPYLIANLVYKPSYISFETALSYYHVIPETVYSITSATSQTSRNWTIKNIDYLYRKIKKSAYCGYSLKSIEGDLVLIATPEKALADYCYFFFLGKIKEWNNRIDLKKINIQKTKKYLILFQNGKLIKFIKKYLIKI